jgi:hypothetical protein
MTVTMICQTCGQPFETMPVYVKRGQAKHCSIACSFEERRIPLAERFWTKVDKNGPIPEDRPELGPCWVWRGSIRRDGYGTVHQSKPVRRMVSTHIYAYEVVNGPVPAGLQLDHLCRNPACCRPDHLEAVTPQVNVLRSNSLSAQRARQQFCKNGHEFTPENTRVSKRNQRTCRACDREEHRTAAYREKANARRRALYAEKKAREVTWSPP